MKLIFKNLRTFQRMHEGPLGSYIVSYAAEMREQGYCAGAMESQIRLVADFSRWMMKAQITPQKITAQCLLAAPDQETWYGRRDYTLLLVAVPTWRPSLIYFPTSA